MNTGLLAFSKVRFIINATSLTIATLGKLQENSLKPTYLRVDLHQKRNIYEINNLRNNEVPNVNKKIYLIHRFYN